jgi:hypothetical protein
MAINSKIMVGNCPGWQFMCVAIMFQIFRRTSSLTPTTLSLESRLLESIYRSTHSNDL